MYLCNTCITCIFEMNEWMNEWMVCLMTTQHEKQIDFWLSDKEGKEGNILFNDALNTFFYLWLNGIGKCQTKVQRPSIRNTKII